MLPKPDLELLGRRRLLLSDLPGALLQRQRLGRLEAVGLIEKDLRILPRPLMWVSATQYPG